MPNRLAAEKSPYLRQHADNPVDWFPWGEAALARAREEGKPLFLSIGYSTCHWCHVMAHESFENPAVAEVLNRSFVPVKVDREERPDLDRVYMTYVQQTTGHGGWPMSVWLTPEGKPFYGGTYFPPEDRHGRPGFVTLLNTIARHWHEQRAKIESGAEEVVQALRRYAAEGGPRETREEGGPPPLHEAGGAAFDGGLNYFHEAYDPQWGGFGGAPKFPRASVIDFLFRAAVLQGVQSESGAEAVRMAAHTLQKMAEGGLHDHVGGGFHRYSVDERWHVPHFEKMLYDQALIAGNFLEAMQITGRPAFGWAARDIFAYVRRDLLGPHGGFYSAEDADSTVPEATVGRVVPDEPSVEPGNGSAGGFALPKSKTHIAQAEGAFYVWTKEEIVQVLGDDAGFFCAHFGVKPSGNVQQDPHGEFTGKNILMQQQSLAQTARDFHLELPEAEEKLASALERLREIRAQRPRPHLDDKVITAWNGLMISALARGYQVFGATSENDAKERDGWLELANRAAEFIERELYDAATGTLYRSWRESRSDIPAFAEDHAFLIQGLLDLYEASFEIRWLQWAEKLQAKMDELFWDAERGGYFSSRAGDPTVIVRLKEDYDGAEPAANSIATLNLLRLDWMIGGNGGATPSSRENERGVGTPPPVDYRDHALRTIEAFRRQWGRVPQAMPEMLCGVELALAEPRTVVLAGDPASEDFRVMAAVLREKAGPRRAILCADGGLGQAWLAARAPWLAEMHPKDGRATAYVCEHHVCRPPVNDPAALRAELR